MTSSTTSDAPRPRHTIAVERPADPEAVFAALSGCPGVFWLDSAGGPSRLACISLMGCNPIATLVTRGRAAMCRQNGQAIERRESPWRAIGRFVNRWPKAAPGAEPFAGGVVGYFGYPLSRFVERLPSRAVRDNPLPDASLGFYDAAIMYDHARRSAAVVGIDVDGQSAQRRAFLADVLRSAGRAPAVVDLGGLGLEITSNVTHKDYRSAIARTLGYIAAGDIFQANISQRFTAELPASITPMALYGRLRRANPSPFAAYLDVEGGAVLSSSPERFLRLEGRRIQTRPIKGTRPRSNDPDTDAALGRELLASEKDNAELAMIVDLQRNDIGRVARYGTVRVTEARVLESYPTVHHLVSTVEGELHPRYSAANLLQACFPGGSITGAPKIRSMEIIDELEPTARVVYTGAIGYIGAGGVMDTNIVIRTIEMAGQRLYFQAGGGIVADSDPEAEYQETLHKAQGIFRALGARWER